MILNSVGGLLHHCSKLKAYRHGQTLHASIIKTALFQTDTILTNHLLNMYAKCNDISSAEKVFDEMPQKNLVSWSAIISGHYQTGNYSIALRLFSLMELQPNEFVYASAISACSSLMDLSHGKQIHAQALKTGFESISFVSNSLISLYMNRCLCDDAYKVFSSTEITSVVSYNALISGFSENKQPERGLEAFRLMRERGVVPDQFTLVGVLGICADGKDMVRATQVHCIAVKVGLDAVAFVGNVIVVVYSKCNCIEEMEKAFRGIEEDDVISWNTVISACCLSGDYVKGLGYFRDMVENGRGVSVDDFTLTSSLACCAGITSIHHGKQIHAHIVRTRVHMDVGVGNALVNMYAKGGSLECALTVFYRMTQHNLVSWNTIIVALGNHGLGERALYLFEEMKAHGIKPDSVTFIGLLSSCNHVGLVDEGESCFSAMKEMYGVSPEIEHLSCLIDLLGRGGRLNKAKDYLEKFPFWNDPVILGSLLSACRLHKHVTVGEWVASQLKEFQPVTSSPYVLMSNLYASSGMWDGVADTWKMLKGSGIRKETGFSLVEVKGVAEKFTVGDLSHSSIRDVKEILGTLYWEVGESIP